MLLKTIFVSISMTLLSLTAFASPSQQEKAEWCTRVAEDALTGARVNQVLKVPADVFQAKLMQYLMVLMSAVSTNEITQEQAMELVEAVLEGWDSNAPPDETAALVFEKCMKRTSV